MAQEEHPPWTPDWRRGTCIGGCGDLVKRNRGGWVEVAGTPSGSWLVAMPTSAGRGVSTDSNDVPTEGIFMLGVAHHGCVDAAFRRVMTGMLTFAYPLVEVVADVPGELPPMHLPPGPDDCLFCDRLDGARLTDEHVWSEWFQRELIALGARFPGYGPGRETAPLGPTVPVCTTCNNRWMSVLENDAKPLIVDMWRHPRLLEPPDQELLAIWATKTAIVFDAHGEVTIPRRFGHELRVSRRPSAGVWVWATMVAGPPSGLAAWLRPLRLAPKGEPPPAEPNGVCVTFTASRSRCSSRSTAAGSTRR